jgi:hypothetical protein
MGSREGKERRIFIVEIFGKLMFVVSIDCKYGLGSDVGVGLLP